jgi:hypothetical protein
MHFLFYNDEYHGVDFKAQGHPLIGGQSSGIGLQSSWSGLQSTWSGLQSKWTSMETYGELGRTLFWW